MKRQLAAAVAAATGAALAGGATVGVLVAGVSTAVALVGVFAAADLALAFAEVVSVAEDFVNLVDSTAGGSATEVVLGVDWVSMDFMGTTPTVMAVVLMDTITMV